MTVDDSTSMHADFLPDYIIGVGAEHGGGARLLPRRQRRDEPRVRLRRVADVASPHLSPDEFVPVPDLRRGLHQQLDPRLDLGMARAGPQQRAQPRLLRSVADLPPSAEFARRFVAEHDRVHDGPGRSVGLDGQERQPASQRQRRACIATPTGPSTPTGILPAAGATTAASTASTTRRRSRSRRRSPSTSIRGRNVGARPTIPSTTGGTTPPRRCIAIRRARNGRNLCTTSQQVRLQHGNVHSARRHVVSADLQCESDEGLRPAG